MPYTEEEKDRLVQFFKLLLKVDMRLNPQYYYTENPPDSIPDEKHG